MHIASILAFHEKTKHIELDCQFVREKMLGKVSNSSHMKSVDQSADLFTKLLGVHEYNIFVISWKLMICMLQFEGEC